MLGGERERASRSVGAKQQEDCVQKKERVCAVWALREIVFEFGDARAAQRGGIVVIMEAASHIDLS